jgi:hypothetical protein
MIRILIGLSLLINAVLIGYVIGYVELLLFLSVLLICGLVWYIRKTLDHYNEIDDDFASILEDMFSFEEHLQQVYQMEMFYGDQTLEAMIQHMSEIIDEITFYREKYFFAEDVTQEGEEDDSEKETQTQN